MSPRKKGPAGDRPDDYEVIGSGSGRKPGGVVSVRLGADEMDMLTALAEVGGRTLSETLRLGLRCLSQQPSFATGGRVRAPRLDTSVTTLVIEDTAEPREWSQPNATRAPVLDR